MYQFPENIFATIRAERDDFINNQIEIVPGYTFNQYDNIKKIHLYYNSRYVDGQFEEINGVKRQKVFFNISKYRCDVGTKMLDIDTKDFNLIAKRPGTEWNVMLLEKELKAWLKKNKMGKILNEVVRLLPIYGSVVLKKIEGGAEIVDLRNLFNDQSAASLSDSRYVDIKHLMSPADLRKMKGIWNDEAIDETIENQCTFTSQSYEGSGQINEAVGSPYAEVWERYGEVPKSWFAEPTQDEVESEDTPVEWTLAKFVVAGARDVTTDDSGKVTCENGIILYKEEIKELPFKEVHLNKTEGRWQGIGFVEDTFEAQRMTNRVKNLEDRALELASMIVLQTEDSTVVKNLLSDVETGDIFVTKKALNRVDTSQKSLAEFRSVSDDYANLADRITFSSDLLSGDQAPASATATAVMNQLQQAASVFDYKKENIGLFLEEFVTDLVFPQLEEELKKGHFFRYVGSPDELNSLKQKYADNVLANALDILAKQDIEIDPAVIDQERQRIMDSIDTRNLWLKTEDNFFQGIEDGYEVDLVITSEASNVQVQLQNTQALLTMLATNPGILQNPVLKRLLFRILTLQGMSPTELDAVNMEASQPESQIAPPTPTPTPVPTKVPAMPVI